MYIYICIHTYTCTYTYELEWQEKRISDVAMRGINVGGNTLRTY